MMPTAFEQALSNYASELAANFRVLVAAQPEDQLKAPIIQLLAAAGSELGLDVVTRTEAQVADLDGRPDMGVSVGRLLTGHIELKAPEVNADPRRFTGRNKKQWEKFKSLPNLIYTNGSEWLLFRLGEQKGRTIRFHGDVTRDGTRACTSGNASDLLELLRDFLYWQPIVPSTPRDLAKLLAPLCRLVRDDVAVALQDRDSNLALLEQQWHDVLFSIADRAQFTDAYAQTLTYALLLAKFSGLEEVTPDSAANHLDTGHSLLAQALRILCDPQAREEIGVGLDLLMRVISAIDPERLKRKGHAPWLYFYEDFLAAYDKKLRKDRGVYYTPTQVIHAQVRLVSCLLRHRFGKRMSYADEGVVFLDPAAGTGAYPLAAFQHGMELLGDRYGKAGVATEMAKNIHAFEILVGPYAVAHLRLTQSIMDVPGAALPADGIHVYLTDTLESPYTLPEERILQSRQLSQEHTRAQQVKKATQVLICMGNPPYDRQQIEQGTTDEERKGGWVRFGDGNGTPPIFEDFLQPAREAGYGRHLKNVYNDYVYFWRWALWKVFESSGGSNPGIVSLITASSYIRGPGFVGIRQVMRQTFDELWIIDLEGDNLGARKTENVFNIQTPVAIALGVRYGIADASTPANVHYTRITGTKEEKLGVLDRINAFSDLEWSECYSGWQQPFLPVGKGDFYAWPLLTDIFPWQHTGAQYKRTWPIAETKEVLEERWKSFVDRAPNKRASIFKETRDRVISRQYRALDGSRTRLPALTALDLPLPQIKRYGYRSFDRQWAFADTRLGDFIKPVLWNIRSSKQVYLTSLLTGVLGAGPAATVSPEVPDIHHFRGSFGGKGIIPLWRDAAATDPNVASGLLETLSVHYNFSVTAADLFSYSYALLACPGYVDRFSEELIEPGPRIPITKDASLFQKALTIGKHLIFLHTYGERFVPEDTESRDIPQGLAHILADIPANADCYPIDFEYDQATKRLRVGSGIIGGVAPEVWEFSVSGLQVVKSWLGYRMKESSGRNSSALDNIRPLTWTLQLTSELMELIWILEGTIALFPELQMILDEVVASQVFTAAELPQPTEANREPPQRDDNTPVQGSLGF